MTGDSSFSNIFLYVDRLFRQKTDTSCFHSAGFGSQNNFSGCFICLYDSCKHSVESVHLRKMEQVETRGVTVGSGTVFSGTFDGEVDQTTVGRAEVAVFVHHFHCHISEVFAVCRQFVPVADQFDVMMLDCGAYTLFCYCFYVFR